MLRRAAAAFRSAWPFDSWDIVGLVALAMLGVGVAGAFGIYAALIVVGALLLGLVLLVALRGAPPPVA